MQPIKEIPFLMAWLWVFLGILISLVLPVAIRTLRSAKASRLEGARRPNVGQRLINAWAHYGGNRYLTIGLAAAFVAGALLFFTGQSFLRIRDAVLAGFAWESFVNKLYSGKTDG